MSIFDLLPPFQTARSLGEARTSSTVEGEEEIVTLGTADVVDGGSDVRVTSGGAPLNTLRSSGPSAELPAAFPPAASPERLRLVGEIGQGGMGFVASAVDSVLLRRVARKSTLSPAADDPDSTVRFLEEAQITAQLDHPNIVPVHDLALNPEDGRLFFTMKLVDGETLGSIIQKLHAQPFESLSFERVLRIVLKVCDAVAFAHSRGVVHRDLKPENIMVGSHGQVYVMDWGVALLLDDNRASADLPELSLSVPPAKERPGTVVGTVQYMAPEQALGLINEQGVATDVFGIGAVLYHLLTGVGPNTRGTYSEALFCAKSGDVPPPETRPAWPTLPPGLCAIVMKALSPFPRDRHASVEDLRRRLEEFLAGGGWFQTRTFQPGEIIVREGDVAGAAFIVIDGTCEVTRKVGDTNEVIRRIGTGEIFGETALLTQKPRVATVTAKDSVSVMVITEEALARELDKSEWMRILVNALATRFREMDQERAGNRP